MSFDEIMDEIRSGLTGDAEQDIQILLEAADEHRESEYAREILRECGRILYSILPEEKRAEINKLIEEDEIISTDPLDEWVQLKNNNELDAALELIESYAHELFNAQEEGMCAEDQVSKYYDFYDVFEYTLIEERIRPEKKIRKAIAPFSRAYGAYASSLYDAGRYMEAICWNKRALEWNPASFNWKMEIAEAYKRLEDIDETDKWIDSAYDFAIKPWEMARWLRAKAFVAIEREDYEIATAELVESLKIEVNDVAVQELLYIKCACGFELPPPDKFDTLEVLEAHGVPTSIPAENIEMLYGVLSATEQNGDEETALQCALSLYAFTGDEALLEKYGEYIVDETEEVEPSS